MVFLYPQNNLTIYSAQIQFCGSMQHTIVTMLSNHIVHNNMKSFLTIFIYLFFSISFLHAIIISILPATNWLYFISSNLIFLFAYSSCNFNWGQSWGCLILCFDVTFNPDFFLIFFCVFSYIYNLNCYQTLNYLIHVYPFFYCMCNVNY